MLNQLSLSDLFCAQSAQCFDTFFKNKNTFPLHVTDQLKDVFEMYKGNFSAQKVLKAI